MHCIFDYFIDNVNIDEIFNNMIELNIFFNDRSRCISNWFVFFSFNETINFEYVEIHFKKMHLFTNTFFFQILFFDQFSLKFIKSKYFLWLRLILQRNRVCLIFMKFFNVFNINLCCNVIMFWIIENFECDFDNQITHRLIFAEIKCLFFFCSQKFINENSFIIENFCHIFIHNQIMNVFLFRHSIVNFCFQWKFFQTSELIVQLFHNLRICAIVTRF